MERDRTIQREPSSPINLSTSPVILFCIRVLISRWLTTSRRADMRQKNAPAFLFAWLHMELLRWMKHLLNQSVKTMYRCSRTLLVLHPRREIIFHPVGNNPDKWKQSPQCVSMHGDGLQPIHASQRFFVWHRRKEISAARKILSWSLDLVVNDQGKNTENCLFTGVALVRFVIVTEQKEKERGIMNQYVWWQGRKRNSDAQLVEV